MYNNTVHKITKGTIVQYIQVERVIIRTKSDEKKREKSCYLHLSSRLKRWYILERIKRCMGRQERRCLVVWSMVSQERELKHSNVDLISGRGGH